MQNSPYRRQKHDAARGGGDSARLLHSKSGSAAATVASQVHSESEKTPINSAKKKAKKQEATDGADGFVRFLPRGRSQTEVPRRTRSGATSPSAWALSPGRSSPWSSPAPVSKSPARFEKLTKQEAKVGGGRGGRGVSGVLKYFRQKKVSPVLEEEYHRYRVAYNWLLQWRFANARAEASMGAVRRAAQKKLWDGWIKLFAMRNSTAEKRIQIQKLKHRLKVHQILQPEIRLLDEWSRIEKRNAESIGRVVRKLTAISVCLPFVQNAEGETTAVDEAISTATEVMDGIKAMVLGLNGEVEKACFLLTELSIILKQQKQLFQELEKSVTHAASFAVQEKILRAQQIQLIYEVKAIEG